MMCGNAWLKSGDPFHECGAECEMTDKIEQAIAEFLDKKEYIKKKQDKVRMKMNHPDSVKKYQGQYMEMQGEIKSLAFCIEYLKGLV